MARWGSVDYRQLVKFRDKLEKLQSADIPKFQEKMVKELVARLLRKVIYNSPSDTGTLKNGWLVETEREAEIRGAFGVNPNVTAYVKTIHVNTVGNVAEFIVDNPVEYAVYVEYGHRTSSHNGWVPGIFMMTISEKELQQNADKIVQQKLERLLRSVFDGQ